MQMINLKLNSPLAIKIMITLFKIIKMLAVLFKKLLII